MASTVIHVSFAVIIACSLIPLEKFSYKSLIIVILPVALLDIDALAFVIKEGLHRSLLHNIIIPTVIIVLIYYDLSISDESYIGNYYDKEYVMIISFTSYIAVIFAGIAIDFASNGVNLFWPLYDHFYTLDGQFVFSSEEGVIQTFTDTFFNSNKQVRTTDNHVYKTPINPAPKSDETSPTIIHIAYTGWQVVIILTSITILSLKSVIKRIYN